MADYSIEYDRPQWRTRAKRLINRSLLLAGFAGAVLASAYLYVQVQTAGLAHLNDRTCLAFMGYHEGRSSPILAEAGDMHVVLNRASLGAQYPKAICDVVAQQLGVQQFSFLLQPLAKLWPKEARAWVRSQALADIVLRGQEDPTKGAIFFIARNGRNNIDFSKAEWQFLHTNPRAISGRLIGDQRFFWLSDKDGNIVTP